MAKLSDQELLFLSNLTYMKPEIIYGENGNKIVSPFLNIWENPNYKRLTVGTILNMIDTDALLHNKYFKDFSFDGGITGSEWADMIDAMKGSDICELTLRDVSVGDKKSFNAYFTDKDGNAYAVFRGADIGGWENNLKAAYVADTERQRQALDYINGIDSENITVIGDSGGGNEAKYVALLSNRVTHCVSFNGQGFSHLFMEKYQDLILENKHKITCYAFDEDITNILLYDIYKAKFFVKSNGDQKPIFYNFEFVNQAKYMAKLHYFINYVAAALPEAVRGRLFSYLGGIISMKTGKMPPDYIKRFSEDQLTGYLISKENTDKLGLVLSYIVAYDEYDKGITGAFLELLAGMGLGILTKWLQFLESYANEGNVLRYILKKCDAAVLILKANSAPNGIIDFIEKAAKAYKGNKYIICPVTAENTAEYDMPANNTIRDYSEVVREMLLNLTNEVAFEKPYDVTKWDTWYGMEEWYRHLNIINYQQSIDDYYRKVADINGMSNQQLQLIFYNVDYAVKSYTLKMNEETRKLRDLSNKIRDLINTDINSAC